MTWTYEPTTLADTPKDQVRLLIQDVDTNDRLMQDEEINLFLTLEGASVYRAAAACCESIALQLAKQETLDGDVKVDPQKSSARYSDMAKRYRQQAHTRGVLPFAGGISRADKQTRASNTDAVAPGFTRDLHDGQETTTPQPGCVRW